MESVLLPMEPVEPRIANFFTSFIFSDERYFAGGTPCVWGYFGSKLFVYNNLWDYGVAKIFYLTGLRLKYCIETVYGA